MDAQILEYFKFFSFFVIGVIIGRLTMAIQYAVMKPKKTENPTITPLETEKPVITPQEVLPKKTESV